ncbi:5'-3' exonuclease [Metabacillus sediminilitoris]|uniref:5'-3' exonuclease n=1 Tax=Metabacillus sediminilitoris TaxID=2567941 RepID=A0A4S4BMM8_9BACI|nr:5'-3' exonuclease [Metabacillus sediminilitoris]QGQ46614.1 5'-3' exonuclease [Metabacillus sediminilitoris]THF76011.1 5'-3' exonuclease [Metabacillus sediminilitoris]
MNKENHLLIVDGMALLFRSFYATSVYGQFMINSKGIPTNAVNGLLKHLIAAIDFAKPTHVVCCWDMGSKTYRNDLFRDYKANRPEAPIELIPQFDLAKTVVEALDIPNLGIEGFEADDCIGTLTKNFESEMKISILTGDKDILQLLNENVDVMIFQKGIGNYKHFTKQSFMEEFEIEPHMLIDVKALMGDSSDNYPGVKGIGEKTAYKLINQYRSIDRLLESLDELTKGQKSKIENDLEMLHLSRRLAEINCQAPLQCLLEDALLVVNEAKVFAMIQEIELRNVQNLVKNILVIREAI